LSLIHQAIHSAESGTIGGRDNKGLQLTGISVPFIRQLGFLFSCFPAAEPQH
jgi:hypothetical protein